jgi:CSLREA domain-containing protein
MRARALSPFNRSSAIAVLFALIAGAAYVTPAHAAGIVVNTAGDSVNANDGLCSLREAIIAANTNTASGPGAGECAAGFGADTISFAGNYTITLAPALGQLPDVTSQITVNGNGRANTVIQADANPNTATFRVFYVDLGGNLTLNRVTVRNGRCNGSCAWFPETGGGIFSFGDLTVTNSTISGNSAELGGGIYIFGVLTVTNSLINSNTASGWGGGISNDGTLTVTNSTINGNSAGRHGGGIYNLAALTVTNSTINGNSAGQRGGGIFNLSALTVTNSLINGNTASDSGGGISNNSELTVTNSTFADNSAGIFGGGIRNGGDAALVVTNSTVANNAANGSGASGGGIYKDSGVGSVTLRNTIVANSTAGGNCSAGITNDGNNLDSGATCGWGSDNGSQSNVNPKLGPLASNGDPTKTMALLAGSPAINAGADAGCPATDQRGVTRPQGARCDIGAYESPTVRALKSSGVQDGSVLETSENSNQGGPINPTATTFILGDNAGNRQYRSILSFNTSSLPDNAVITKVLLKIKREGGNGTDPFSTHLKIAVDIRQGAFSSAEVLQATDFQAPASKPAVGVFLNDPTAAGWYVTRLKPVAYPFINRMGVTQLRLRFQTDDDNDAVADVIRFYSGNAAADQPALVIEYYVP